MKTKLVISWLAMQALVLAPHAELEIPTYGYACGDQVDWYNELEGSGVRSGNWSKTEVTNITDNSLSLRYDYFGPSTGANPFVTGKRPRFATSIPANMAQPYFEKGDLIYKRLNSTAFNDFHVAVIGPAGYNYDAATKSVKFKVSRYESLSDFFSFAGTGKAPVRNDKVVDFAINLFLPSEDLVNGFQEAVWRFFNSYYGGADFRGARTVEGYYEGLRKNAVTKAQSVVNADIGYIFDDMLDQNNLITAPGWEGTVADIDDIRCDGFAEFSLEDVGARVWGADATWNLGSSSDAAYAAHNDSWEGFDFTLDEVSPMIESGCGGYGKGERTKARSRDVVSKPSIWTSIDANGYLSVNVQDYESAQIYSMVQVKDLVNGKWYTLNSSPWAPRTVNGNYFTTQLLPWQGSGHVVQGTDASGASRTFTSKDNLKVRVVAVDEGGNVSLKEWVPRGILSTVGASHTHRIQATGNGLATYRMIGPSGTDFDITITDVETNTMIASATGASNDETISALLRENRRYDIKVVAYAGTGAYSLSETSYLKAVRYQVGTFFSTRAENGWEVTLPNIPTGKGYLMEFSRWNTGGLNRDLDMEITMADGTTRTSTGSMDFEWIPLDYQAVSKLKVYDYLRGGTSSDANLARNVFTIWRLAGEG